MNKFLLSVIITVSGAGFASANKYWNTSPPADCINTITGTTKILNGKKCVLIPLKIRESKGNGLEEKPNESLRKVEDLGIILRDDNFKYVKEKRDLVGFALQLASFSDLAFAKDYALKIAQKGDAEKRQLFIYTINSLGRIYYKVYFGLLKSDDSARERQKVFFSLGYSPFVKEFK